MVKKTLKMYYAISQVVVVPWITLDKATDAITTSLKADFSTNAQRLKLVEKIFANTGEPLELDEKITAETLHESFTGDNLRWEILGIIFTYLALGIKAIEGETNQQAIDRKELTSQLVHASNRCIWFCDRAESQNDLLVWLYVHCTRSHLLPGF
jgi:hypothetical protein